MARFNARLSIVWIAACTRRRRSVTWRQIQCPLEHRVDCHRCHRLRTSYEVSIQCPLEHRVDCHPATDPYHDMSATRFNARLSIVWIATRTVRPVPWQPVRMRFNARLSIVWIATGTSLDYLFAGFRFNARLSIVWIATKPPIVRMSIQCPLEHRVDCHQSMAAETYMPMSDEIQCPIEHRVDCHTAVSPADFGPRFNARLSIVWIATGHTLVRTTATVS